MVTADWLRLAAQDTDVVKARVHASVAGWFRSMHILVIFFIATSPPSVS